MKDGYMMFKTNEGLTIEAANFEGLRSFMENNSEPWYIKDKDSKYIYMNESMLYYGFLPKDFNPAGKLDSECPAYWCQYSDITRITERKVMDSQEITSSLVTMLYGDEEKMLQPSIADVAPLIKDGKPIGVVGRRKLLEIYSYRNLIHNTCDNLLNMEDLPELFNDREFEIVFYVINALSMDEVRSRLNYTPEAAETLLQSAYKKAGVNTVEQLIEYCKEKGYDKYAPIKFVSPRPYEPLVD